jgi:hypothetical protein
MMNSEKWLKGRNALIAGIAFAGACGTETAAGDEPIASEPIADVALANGSVVSFFEPSPGEIVVEQEGPLGLAPVGLSQHSAVDLYRSLAPGEVPPAALIAAQARQDAARAERGPARDAGGRAPIAGSAAAPGGPGPQLDNNLFVALYCGGSWDALWCRTDLHGGFFTTYTSVDEAYWTVCSDIGTVTLRIVVGGSLLKDHDVLAGSCYFVHWTSGIFNSSASGQVYNVGGSDQYDHSARYNF